MKDNSRDVRLPPVLRWYSKFFASVATTCCKNSTSVRSWHTLAEAVFIAAFALRRLECSFHYYLFLYYSFQLFSEVHSRKWSAKVVFFELITKIFAKFRRGGRLIVFNDNRIYSDIVTCCFIIIATSEYSPVWIHLSFPSATKVRNSAIAQLKKSFPRILS